MEGNGGAVDVSIEPKKLWSIIHIPEKPLVSPLLQPTVNVVAAEIEPKHANTLVRRLNRTAPLENLRHVKRIQKKRLDGGQSQLFVILSMAHGDQGEPDYLSEDVQEIVNTYQLSTFTIKVCKYAASTKEEWEEQCKLWPTSFHPPTYNIEGITGFSEEDSLSVFNFMKLAVCMANSGVPVVNAAVIVDPSTRDVIASSCDEVGPCSTIIKRTFKETSSPHPETTSQHDAGDHKKDSMLFVPNKSYENVSCLHPWGWVEQGSHPLRHAAIVAIENSAARDRRLYPVDGDDAEFVQEDDMISSATESPLKRHKIDANVKDDESMGCHGNGLHCKSSRPYLCTGYDIYFAWEPCIMCAMAIVHQRVRRVFYAFPNETDGALGSVHRLQGERSLNHHYAVFRVLMPEDP